MGHYYGDLMCNTCGFISCRCNRPAITEKANWTIKDYEVVHRDKIPFIYQLQMTWFHTKEAAENAILPALEEGIKILEDQVVMAEQEVTRLKELRKKLKPA
jgi:hypothetical protein